MMLRNLCEGTFDISEKLDFSIGLTFAAKISISFLFIFWLISKQTADSQKNVEDIK